MTRHGDLARGRDQGGIAIQLAPVTALSSDNSSTGSRLHSSDTGSNASEVGDNYFGKFQSFQPDVNATFLKDFKRLAIQEGWSKKQRLERQYDAVDEIFASLLGTDMTKLEKWQELCKELKIDPAPESITKCKKAIAKVHVNIYNFIDHRRDPARFKLETFRNIPLLREYTLWNHIYPLQRAKKDTFLRSLLRPIFLGGTSKKTS